MDITGRRFAFEDHFGSSVSISGDGQTLVVGAPGSLDTSGYVRAYRKDSLDQVYNQVGDDITAGDPFFFNFGSAVSTSADGTTIAVGSFRARKVRVLKFNSTFGRYIQVGSDIVGDAAIDGFGFAVDISANGSKLIVGAPYSRNGSVSVYNFNPVTNQYVQIGSVIVGTAQFAYFGWSVSISADGRTIVVGAPFLNNGIVRVYKLDSSTEQYMQFGSDIVGEAANDNFGRSVSISADGDTFVVGAPKNAGNGVDAGHIRIYKFNASVNSYSQLGLDIDGEAAKDYFGNSVSISADGTTIVVGAPNENPFGQNPGFVHVYKLNTPIEKNVLDFTSQAEPDVWGYALSMTADGETIVVGAGLDDRNCNNNGVVRLFSNKAPIAITPTKAPSTTGNTPTEIATITPTKAPTTTSNSPTEIPTGAPTTNCGIFGLNIFCPRNRKCGFFRRLFAINGCK